MLRLFETLLTQPLFNLLILLTVWIPGHSLGWAIIALTILIRLILVPSAAQAIRQQQRLNHLQPELKQLQVTFKDDREGLAREMMALYKKYDIHPLGACLPTLVQLPLLLALYYVFRNGLDTAYFDHLYNFVPHPDTINTVFLGINLAEPHQIILSVLAGALQYLQARTLLKGPASQQMNDNQTLKIVNMQMLYMMPIVTMFISYSLPAALPLYWVVTTLFAIGQQIYLFRTLPAAARVAPVVATSSEPVVAIPARRGVSVIVRKKGE